MRIERLEIENFRGIRKMDLDLHPRLNVFVGVNGAGKTTILDASAILLSYFLAEIRATEEPFSAKVTDITHGCSETQIWIRVSPDDGNASYRWGRRIFRGSRPSSYPSREGYLLDSEGFEDYMHQLRTQMILREPLNVPVAILFPTDRTLRYSSTEQIGGRYDDNSQGYPCMAAYKDCLSSVKRFDWLVQWFKEREEKEIRNLANISHNVLHQQRLEGILPEGIDPQLEAVRKTIESFTGFKSPRFHGDPLQLVVTKGDTVFPVGQLSGGEKNMLAMTADIARRLVIANPNRGDDYLEGHGIVMIDEIDLHMHPTWQRMLLPKLCETFPNIQFIVTTHSPQVLSHVEKKSVFLLEQTDEGIVQTPLTEAYGQSYERLLEDVFGVAARPDEVQTELEELFNMIQKNEVTAARKKLAELERSIGMGDPELVRAEFLLHRREEMPQ